MAKIGLPKGSRKRLKVREKSVKSQGILKWILSGNPVFADSEDMNEDEDTEEDNTNLVESSETRPGQRAKINSAVTRQKWSSDEEKEICCC